MNSQMGKWLNGVLFVCVCVCVCVFCSSGLDRFCWFDQSNHCYAALGHKLNLLMVLDSRDQELHLYKKLIDSRELEVFRIKNNKEKKHKSIKNRSTFIFENGTLIINRVIRADSGNYRLEFYRTDGSSNFTKYLPIKIEGTETLSSDSFNLIFSFNLTLMQMNICVM